MFRPYRLSRPIARQHRYRRDRLRFLLNCLGWDRTNLAWGQELRNALRRRPHFTAGAASVMLHRSPRILTGDTAVVASVMLPTHKTSSLSEV